MLLMNIAKFVYRQVNKVLGKFGIRLSRISNGGDYDLLLNCNFQPYEVEYKPSPENMEKLLFHIENVWNNYGKNETYWSVLTFDDFLKRNLNENNIESFYASGMDKMKTMEMHMLPQDVILGIAHKNNCVLLEVHNDGLTGSPTKLVSQTFVFKKYRQ